MVNCYRKQKNIWEVEREAMLEELEYLKKKIGLKFSDPRVSNKKQKRITEKKENSVEQTDPACALGYPPGLFDICWRISAQNA